MKIYVVTSGEYSDFGINALFSTKELAELYIDKFTNKYSEFNDIMEVEVDLMESDLRSDRKPFSITMGKDGEVTYCDTGRSYGTYDGVIREHWHRKDQLEVLLFADDKEQAIKIANEKRLKYLLENK